MAIPPSRASRLQSLSSAQILRDTPLTVPSPRRLVRIVGTAQGGLVFAALMAFVFSAQAGAASRDPVRPVVSSVHVSRRSVPMTGGIVHFTVTIKGANTCRLALAGHASVALAFSKAWQHCSNGTFLHAVRFGANSSQSALNTSFRLYLRRGPTSYWYPLGSVRINGLPATPTSPPSPTASLSISTSTVSSSGGTSTLTYSSTSASSCSMSASPTFWSGSNPESVPCNGGRRLDHPLELVRTAVDVHPHSDERKWSDGERFSNALAIGAGTTARSFDHAIPKLVGLRRQGGSTLITSIRGQWTVPTLNCADTPNAGMASWVGIGGAGNGTGDLWQTGITSNCVGGSQQDFAWWELAPEYASVSFSGFTISPGDSIEAYAFQIESGCTTNCGQWETLVEDLTTGLEGVEVTTEGWGVAPIGSNTFTYQGTTPSLTYAGGYSGEWIVEDYEQEACSSRSPTTAR